MSLRRFTVACVSALALTGVLATSALARPPGPPPGGPGWHHPAPPRHHGHHHYGWLWAPAVAGLTIWGLSELFDDPYDDGYVPYRYRYPAQPTYVVPDYGSYSAAASAAASAARAESAANAAINAANSARTLYWCEAEGGFYPQVRACPTGWTPVVAP